MREPRTGRSDGAVPRRGRPRGERGVALPSPVVLLSIVAIAMAAVAYVATQATPPTEREVAIVARDQAPSEQPSRQGDPEASRTETAAPKAEKRTPLPPVRRGQIYVDVYNNSGITGLAGQVGGDAAQAGWQVADTDNWYGSVPATTVYYPSDLRRAGKQLALDLGVDRTLPAVGSMSRERLTLILTAPLG